MILNLAKRFERVPTLLLVGVLVGLLIIRVMILSGDGVGPAVVVVAFWLAALCLLLRLVVGLVLDRGRLDYVVLLVALFAVFASAVLGKRTVGPVTFVIFLLAVFGLLALWIGRWRRRESRST